MVFQTVYVEVDENCLKNLDIGKMVYFTKNAAQYPIQSGITTEKGLEIVERKNNGQIVTEI